jgi:elongation factor Ts
MNNTTILVKELREATGASFLDCKQALVTHAGDYEQATAFLQQRNLKKAAKKADRQTSEGLIIVKANDGSVCAVELNCETDFVAMTPDFKAFAHQLADLVLSDETITDAEKLATVPSMSSGQAISTDNPAQTIQDDIQVLIGRLSENIQLGHVAHYTADQDTIVHGYVHAGAIDGYGPDEGRLGVLVAVAFGDKTTISDETSHAIAHELALHIASATPKYVSVADIPAEVLAEKKAELLAQVATMNKPEAIKEQIVTGRLNKFYRQTCLLEQPFLKDDSLTVAEWLVARGDEIGTAVTVLSFTRIAIETS